MLPQAGSGCDHSLHAKFAGCHCWLAQQWRMVADLAMLPQAGSGCDHSLHAKFASDAAMSFFHRNPGRLVCSRAIDRRWSSARYHLDPQFTPNPALPPIAGLPFDCRSDLDVEPFAALLDKPAVPPARIRAILYPRGSSNYGTWMVEDSAMRMKSKQELLQYICDHDEQLTWYPLSIMFPRGTISDDPSMSAIDVVEDFIVKGLVVAISVPGETDRYRITKAGREQLAAR